MPISVSYPETWGKRDRSSPPQKFTVHDPIFYGEPQHEHQRDGGKNEEHPSRPWPAQRDSGCVIHFRSSPVKPALYDETSTLSRIGVRGSITDTPVLSLIFVTTSTHPQLLCHSCVYSRRSGPTQCVRDFRDGGRTHASAPKELFMTNWLLALIMLAGLVASGDQLQTKDQDRLHDGSCGLCTCPCK